MSYWIVKAGNQNNSAWRNNPTFSIKDDGNLYVSL